MITDQLVPAQLFSTDRPGAAACYTVRLGSQLLHMAAMQQSMCSRPLVAPGASAVNDKLS
eukprot:6212850-Pleurochrysis_carterae.AAC.9